MSDLSVLSKIISIYGDSVQLIRNRLVPPESEDLSNESIISSIVRQLLVVSDCIVENELYSYCNYVQELIEHILKLSKSLPDLKKIEVPGIVSEVRKWEEKSVHSDNEECETMLNSLRSLLGELFI